MGALTVAGGLAGCERDPQQARLDAVQEAWQRDPREAVRMVEGMDELEQLAVVELVFSPTGRGGDTSLCVALTNAAVRARCEQSLKRAHLAFYKAGEQGDTEEEWACLAGFAPVEVGEDTPFGQAVALASEAPSPGAERGLAICRCLQSTRLREECAFRLAEVLAGSEQARAEAMDACLTLEPRVAPMCVEHAMGVAGLRVALDRAEGLDWSLALSMAAQLADAPSAVADDSADGLLGFFWSDLLFSSVAEGLEQAPGSLQLAPGLVDNLPTEAQPHLRAAIAWAVVAAGEEQAGGEVRLERARAVLSGAAPLQLRDPGHPPGLPTSCPPLADPPPPGTRFLHYLTSLSERRIGAEEADLDLGHAVRAAEACLRPPGEPSGDGGRPPLGPPCDAGGVCGNGG